MLDFSLPDALNLHNSRGERFLVDKLMTKLALSLSIYLFIFYFFCDKYMSNFFSGMNTKLEASTGFYLNPTSSTDFSPKFNLKHIHKFMASRLLPQQFFFLFLSLLIGGWITQLMQFNMF